jgi:radical SAM-linked protein
LKYTMAFRFKIGGNLRFLSHQETVRLFQRALVRSGIKLNYSEGFNPRPRISLPLPRSVGLEGDAELLCALTEIDTPAESKAQEKTDAEQIRGRLEGQLPQDCRLVSLDLIKGRAGFHPEATVYELELSSSEMLEDVKKKAEQLTAEEHLTIERRINEKGSTRTVDIGGFVESIEFDGLKITATCKITPSGTIRVDEILRLLGIRQSMMVGSVKRAYIKWRITVS